ncbi:MAG TPA: TonB-dependent receptor plug domain-containing protein [Opitutaceae bacterium]|nr:TonB-dependent receptor plug domain-containing protein [Opitutaceae bacterium]
MELSPFQVVADTNGYFQANTMSGTRLNSKIEDLGQSISVMTKQQMNDFALLDINDVFDHMANTEGTGSFSNFVLDRTGAVTDNVSFDPNNSNRVRGIGNANIAFDDIATTGRVPIDPLWIDSVEVSRGPNANLFGLGQPSGTVNQVPAFANLARDFTQIQTRGDSYGGWRASIDFNRQLIPDKLSVRASEAFEHIGFVRKPSGEAIRRESLQLKARPFPYTTISASYFRYTDTAQRPNFTTPRDFITPWLQAGKPAWNPVTRLITVGGVTYGMGAVVGGVPTMVAGSTTPFTTLPPVFGAADQRSYFYVPGASSGLSPYWTTPTVTSLTSPLVAATNSSANLVKFVQTAAPTTYGTFGSTQPLFASTPAVSDKSVYDYGNINLDSANRQWDDVKIYLAQLDQIIISTGTQTLAAQVTYMRENAKRILDLPTGPASVNGVTGALYANPNSLNLDGTTNPYFGLPYLKTTEPFRQENPELWSTTRAQLAYKLDLTQQHSLLKWLGVQQLLGYDEYKDQRQYLYSYRHSAMSLDQPWEQAAAAAGIPLANRTTAGNRYPVAAGNASRLVEEYYVGSTPGGPVQYGPSFFPNNTVVPYLFGGSSSASTSAALGQFSDAPTMIGWTPSPDGGGFTNNKDQIIKTAGAVLQSTFLDDSLVTTFGIRQDTIFATTSDFAVLTPDLRAYNYPVSDGMLPGWSQAGGKTKSASVVLRPFHDLKFMDPWANQGSALQRFFGQALHNIGLTFNKADNFIPAPPAIDLEQNQLPNQTGSSKDYGFWINTLDNRLTIHYTHYQTEQFNARNGDVGTMAQRVLRQDGVVASDAYNLLSQATQWTYGNGLTYASLTPSQQDNIAHLIGYKGGAAQVAALSNANNAGTLATAQDIIAKGDELEINFNPNRFWTVSASATKSRSINARVGTSVADWIAQRMPIWTTIEDPRFTASSPAATSLPVGATGHLLWWDILGAPYSTLPFNYNSTSSAASNFAVNVQAPLNVFTQTIGKPRPQLAEYAFKFDTRYELAGITSNKILSKITVGTSLRWIDRAAIGFYGLQSLPATVTQLDPNRPIYTPAQIYADLFIAYKTRMFRDKVGATFQFNVRNLQEDGDRLQATAAFPDGTPLAYRIIDPRQFLLSVTFDL